MNEETKLKYRKLCQPEINDIKTLDQVLTNLQHLLRKYFPFYPKEELLSCIKELKTVDQNLYHVLKYDIINKNLNKD